MLKKVRGVSKKETGTFYDIAPSYFFTPLFHTPRAMRVSTIAATGGTAYQIALVCFPSAKRTGTEINSAAGKADSKILLIHLV